MLTLKTSVAVILIAGTVAATAGVTYVATKSSMQVSVSCPPQSSTSLTPNLAIKPNLPQGAPVPLNQGKTY
jgi:hypothetical protein